MTIQLNCGCGRRYQIGDEHAGKKTKCKACGAVHVIPNPEPEEVFVGVVEDDTEVVDAIEVDDDKTEVMTAIEVEEDEKRTTARRPPRRDPDDEDRDSRRDDGKKRKRRPNRAANSLADQYMAEARGNMRREELRATAGWREDDDQSWTIGGLHITAGVISGAVLILLGLMCIVFIAIFKDDEDIVIGPRIFIGAIVCTVIGIGTLVKSLFFGEED
jgi:hypothetical protein